MEKSLFEGASAPEPSYPEERPRRLSPEARIVLVALALALGFGPLGIAFGGIIGGGTHQSPLRWLELTAWFGLYGLAMGLALAWAWRVENHGPSRPRRQEHKSEYWIGDWSSLLDERPTDGGPAGDGAASAPRHQGPEVP